MGDTHQVRSVVRTNRITIHFELTCVVIEEFTYLAADGEDATTGGVHEDELAAVGAVGVDSEDEFAGGVVGSEAVSGEEEGSLEHCQMRFFSAHGHFFHDRSSLHLNFSFCFFIFYFG